MKTCVFAVLAVVLTGTGIAGQSTGESIQGVWQTVEVGLTGPDARIIKIPGPRPNLIILSGKHYCRVEVHAETPRPILADMRTASADELRAVWGPFVGEAGTYEVKAGVLTMRPIAAKNPAAMKPGAFITYSYMVDGDVLTVTQQRNQDGPFANPVTVKAVRVE